MIRQIGHFFSNRQEVAKPSVLVICEFFNDAMKRFSVRSVGLKWAVDGAGVPYIYKVMFYLSKLQCLPFARCVVAPLFCLVKGIAATWQSSSFTHLRMKKNLIIFLVPHVESKVVSRVSGEGGLIVDDVPLALWVAPAIALLEPFAAAIRSVRFCSVLSRSISSFWVVRVRCCGVPRRQGFLRGHLCTLVCVWTSKVPVTPLVGTSGRGELIASYKPAVFGRLPEMVSDQIGLPLLDLHHVLGSHGQVPEHLVVQELCLLPGPRVLEQGVLHVELAKTVSAYKKSCPFTASEVEMFLEEVSSGDTVAGHVGMHLVLRSLPSILQTHLRLTINPTSAEKWYRCWRQKASVSPCVGN